jgi:hypothetical protein
MDIYSIGEEKCIAGVWGREVSGRFYTHYSLIDTSNVGNLYRKLDVSCTFATYYAQAQAKDCETSLKEVASTGMFAEIVEYTPKHLKDLENLKRGDEVWIRVSTSRGVIWGCTRFIEMKGSYYITGDLFTDCRYFDMLFTSSHEEVYLKPPFNI